MGALFKRPKAEEGKAVHRKASVLTTVFKLQTTSLVVLLLLLRYFEVLCKKSSVYASTLATVDHTAALQIPTLASEPRPTYSSPVLVRKCGTRQVCSGSPRRLFGLTVPVFTRLIDHLQIHPTDRSRSRSYIP